MSDTQTAKKKVLIVEDEPGLITYLETLLQDNGYATVSAADGRAGFEMARRERPDLITLDISMPATSGMRLYRELREDPELANVPVIVVTAVTGYGGDSETFKKFMDSRSQFPPPNGFIPKPIKPDDLLEKIAELLP